MSEGGATLGTMKIGITGGSGLLGWHLRCALSALGITSVRQADRRTFTDAAALEQFITGLDAVVHLAGMNRGDAQEIEATNIRLAQQLAAAIARTSLQCTVIYSSSMHAEADTAYGRSKRRAGEILGTALERIGGRYVELILPHVFGEHARPNYNSVVATFCHQLAAGEAPEIFEDRPLELLHAQDLADSIMEILANNAKGRIRLEGKPLGVAQLLARLEGIAAAYARNVFPDLDDPLQLRLFNTYRSYLYPRHYPLQLSVHADVRGLLFESTKQLGGGQSFLSWTNSGVTRGNHYHRRKVERFVVVSGSARIRLRRLLHQETVEFAVCGERPCAIDIPTLHTHDIANVGDGKLLTLFWSNEIVDPANPDTYPEKV